MNLASGNSVWGVNSVGEQGESELHQNNESLHSRQTSSCQESEDASQNALKEVRQCIACCVGDKSRKMDCSVDDSLKNVGRDSDYRQLGIVIDTEKDIGVKVAKPRMSEDDSECYGWDDDICRIAKWACKK